MSNKTQNYEDLPDDKNPDFLFSCTHTELLIKIVNGEIKPVELALVELSNRGLNKKGKWVGFKSNVDMELMKDLAELRS